LVQLRVALAVALMLEPPMLEELLEPVHWVTVGQVVLL
jgi:hypothetical protein